MARNSVCRKALKALVFALAGALACHATAQSYPSRPIRMLVGYAAGGPVDNAARKILPALQKELGQSIVIENRGGASGVVAADAVAKAEPDGHTLIFMASPTQVMSPHMTRSMPFDPIKDFTPIAFAVGFATLLVVNKDSPVNTVGQLVAYARANPQRVSFGSAGIGSSNHLAGELLKKDSGASMLHVPYKGNSAAITDLIGGQLTFMFNSVGDSLGFVNSGQVKAIAVSSSTRSRALPNVPTMIESGVAGFDVTAWYALEGPAKMPRPIVARLNAAMNKVLQDPAVARQFYDIGYDVLPSTPEELAARVVADHERWSSVARGIKLD
jgi:tripartite-type tricarboxylate transporter receptor subunit TctC